MTNDRWQRVKALFAQAYELTTARRGALLAAATDSWVREEVVSLLAADKQAAGFRDGADAAEPTYAPVDITETRLGNYRLIDRLGSGGMGCVYLGVRDDGSFQKRVAIKVLQPGAAPALAQRVRVERQVLAALDHPNVVRLLDGGQMPDGSPYLVMEYTQGLPIDDFCQRHDLPTRDRLRLFLLILSAVSCAHQNLVLHCDIKPRKAVADGGQSAGVPQRPEVPANKGLGTGSIFGVRGGRLARGYGATAATS